MLYDVKSFCKVQFQDEELLFSLLALVDIFKCPGQAVLNSSCFDEAILNFGVCCPSA